MHPTDRNVALVCDEMSIKQSLVYNEGTDSVEEFEDFGNLRQTRYIANHARAFMVRTCFKMETASRIFPKFWANKG